MKKKILIMLAVLSTLLIFVWVSVALHPDFKYFSSNTMLLEENGLPLVIAHGGGNEEFPDNTLEACYNAYHADNNVMLELDTSITKDGVAVLTHDTTLDYRTNARGKFEDWTYTDLVEQRVDFSYLNERKKVRGKKRGPITKEVKYTDFYGKEVTPLDVVYPEGVVARDPKLFLVSTFEEVLQAFPNNPINIEIKQKGETGHRALDEVIRLITKYNAFDRVVLASFHESIYNELKSLVLKYQAEGITMMISPTFSGVAKMYFGSLFGVDVFYDEPVSVMQVPMGAFCLRIATKRFVRACHSHNIAVHYWTIDDIDDMQRLVDIGADGIMTNLPHTLKSVIDSNRD